MLFYITISDVNNNINNKYINNIIPSQTTNRTHLPRRQTTGRSHHDTLDKRKATGHVCHYLRHICQITYLINVSIGWSRGKACGDNQSNRVVRYPLHSHLPSIHRDSRLMGCPSRRANWRDWKTDNCSCGWREWDDVLFLEAFHGNPEGQCSIMSPHSTIMLIRRPSQPFNF